MANGLAEADWVYKVKIQIGFQNRPGMQKPDLLVWLSVF
jgi:hypothetical protein